MDYQFHVRPPENVVIPPKQEHKHTFILLHGRGDRADAFGIVLFNTCLADGTKLDQLFPNAKFVLLQAPARSLATAPGHKWHQWFDVWNFEPGSEESDLQVPGLRETVHLIHGTLRQEIELVGSENVVLGGLSQGCASSLTSLLLWDGPPFAACFGMCGWLPFRKLMEDLVRSPQTETNEKAASGEKTTVHSRPGEAVAALAQVLGYSDSFSAPLIFQQIPLFLGHGMNDNVIVPSLGQEAALCIDAMHAKVTFRYYNDLGHWYSPLMLQDIMHFIRAETKWTNN